MILFFSGVFSLIGLLLLFGAGYLIGNKNTPKTMTRPPTSDDNEIQKQIKIRKDFNELMSYNEDKARQRKKV